MLTFLQVENLVVNGLLPGGQAETLGVAVDSRLLSINGKRVSNDMEMSMTVKTSKPPLKIWFTKVKKPDAVSRMGVVWKISGGMEGKKWKKKNLELNEAKILMARSQNKKDFHEDLPLEECLVEEITEETDAEWVEKHKKTKDFKEEKQFFFRVKKEDCADPAKDCFVFCLEDENEFKGWMQMLRRKCGKQPKDE